MPRAALQQDDIAAFRARATAAATRLFAKHGYEGVTMRALADELGVSAMTSYRYLTGKDELFALVRAEAFRRFGDALAGSAGRITDATQRLLRLKRAYIQFALDHSDAYRIMFEIRTPSAAAAAAAAAGTAAGATDADSDVDRESRRAFGFLHDAVRAAVDAHQLAGDALAIARLLWASTHGLVSLYLAGRLSLRALEQLAAVDHELAGFRTTTAPTPPSRSRSPR
ncbi:MAG TPA: TetR/AcrR family transcriptional regulator [Kofleriaceae bacterium]|nr:TetR/AcrR family transcriptional regulator [Kofleriaceae bacterium]